MPVYEYECMSCGAHHEIMQRYTDLPLSKCPTCGGLVRKLISNTSFVLKGTGWYKTDYASAGSDKSTRGARGNGAKTERKPEAKPEPKLESASKKE